MPDSTFLQLNEDTFEDLCCDLLAKEENVDSAQRFGLRGQRQDGIDIRGYCKDGTTQLGQCKRYSLFTSDDFAKAIKVFRNAHQLWADWHVQRFIIFVASSVRERKLQDAFQKERQKFGAEGISLELWGDDTLRQRLRDRRFIAEKYFAGESLREICGSVFTYGGTAAPVAEAATAITAFLEELPSEVSAEAEADIVEIRQLVRIGQARKALKQLDKYLQSTRWNFITPVMRARMLRLRASLALDCDDDVSAAERFLADGQRENDRENFQVIEAAIALRKQNAETALDILQSPVDVDALNYRIAVLTQLGKAEEALQLAATSLFEPSAGTQRLASIAAVLSRDYKNAKVFSDRAFELGPRWYLVRLHAAKVKYLAGVLPSFSMWPHLAWPIPPDNEFVKLDQSMLSDLRTAADDLADLLATCELDRGSQFEIEAWRLGCIASDPDRSSHAAQLIAETLVRDATNVPAVAWAMHLNLPFDKHRFTDAIAAEPPELCNADAVQALVALYIQQGRFDEASELLARHKEGLTARHLGFVWRLLACQVEAAKNNLTAAENVIKTEPEETNRILLRRAALRVTAIRTGNFADLAKFLDVRYAGGRSPEYLFDLCESWLRSGQSTKVASHADELLQHFPTIPALGIATEAAAEANRPKLCLKLLNQHKGLFGGKELPPAFRRLEIRCLTQIGKLTDATKAAETLAASDSAVETLVSLFSAQMLVGDRRAGAVTARELINRPEITPGGLLQAARAVHAEDPALAVQLWEEAVRRGVDEPHIVASAVELGFRLGLEDRLAPIMPRFVALANLPGAPVSAHPIDEVRRILEEDQKGRETVFRHLAEGAIPLHIAAGRLRIPFSVLMGQQSRANVAAPKPLLQFPLLTRAGSKGAVPLPRSKKHRIFADVSALMIAEFLDVLDIVEQTYGPLLVSPHVPSFLQQEISKSMPHQPALQPFREAVLQQVDGGRLSVLRTSTLPTHDRQDRQIQEEWRQLLEYARLNGAVVCDFDDPRDDNFRPVVLDQDEQKIHTTCRDLAAALFHSGKISETQFHAATKRLGVKDQPTQRQMTLSPHIVLGGGVAQHLGGAGLLDELISNATVYILDGDVATLRSEVSAHNERLRIVAWLKQLQDRIHHGLSDGRYKTVQYKTKRPSGARAPETEEEYCLWDLLNAKAAGARVAWCDDRFLTRYKQVGRVPPIDTIDVLSDLRARGQIDTDRLFRCIHRLRDANARYVPVSSEEILYHLGRTTVSNGVVTESPALKTIRRYVAACCLDGDRMHPPVVVDGKQQLGEHQWVLDVFRACAVAAAECWKNNQKPIAEAKADWILHNLLFPMFMVLEVQYRSCLLDHGLEAHASAIALLLSTGFTLPTAAKLKATPGEENKRKEFYGWIDSRLLAPMDLIEPALIERAAQYENDTLFSPRYRARVRGDDERALRVILIRTLLDLPCKIESRLNLSRETQAWLRIDGKRTIIGFNNDDFVASEFYSAAAKACSGEAAECQNQSRTSTIHFEPPSDGDVIDHLSLRVNGTDKTIRLFEPRLRLFVGTEEQQRLFLQSHPEWIDRDSELQAQLIGRILSQQDPNCRIELVDEMRSHSAEFFYESLRNKFMREHSLTVEESFPTDIESLVHHLGLHIGDADSVPLVPLQIAERCLSRIGVVSTIERLASLPVLLPDAVFAAFDNLNKPDAAAAVDSLRKRLLTPVSQIHLIHLLLHAARRYGGEYQAQAESLIQTLVSDSGTARNWRVFRCLLSCTQREFAIRHQFRSLSATARLAIVWLHSARLHNLLLQSTADADAVQQAFTNAAEFTGLDLNASDKAFWNDAAHPRKADQWSTILRGLGAVFRTLPEEIASKLRLAGLPNIEPANFHSLLRAAELAPNSLQSYLGGPVTDCLGPLLGDELASQLLPQHPFQVVEQALADIESDSSRLESWKLLDLCLHDLPCDTETTTRIERVIGTTNFGELLASKAARDYMVIHFACGRVQNGMSEAVRDHVKRQVFTLVRQLNDQYHSIDAVRDQAAVIIDSLLLLAMHPDNEAALFREYYELLSEAAFLWPTIAPVLKQRFGGWPSRVPLYRQHGFWRLEFTLRALI
jgi:hypothetical protein